jgi:purine-binding chemotaxis protein CheW
MEANQVKSAAERQLVAFELAGETYGVDINWVHEIIRMQAVTRLPRTPEFIEGVINLRGRIIPVIDLRKRFGLPPREQTPDTRIMVVEMAGVTVGMIVDAVSEVVRLPAESIEPPPPMMHGIDTAYLEGVGKWEDRLVILLNLDRVLRQGEQEQLAETAQAL